MRLRPYLPTRLFFFDVVFILDNVDLGGIVKMINNMPLCLNAITNEMFYGLAVSFRDGDVEYLRDLIGNIHICKGSATIV